jgi:hypothetical protein
MDKPENWPAILNGQPPLSVNEVFKCPGRWGRGDDARDALGESVGVKDRRAVRWCLNGALRLVYGHNPDLHTAMITKTSHWLKEHEADFGDDYEGSIANWNDSGARTFKDVRALVTGAGI